MKAATTPWASLPAVGAIPAAVELPGSRATLEQVLQSRAARLVARQHMSVTPADRQRAVAKRDSATTPPREITNAGSTGNYQGAELATPVRVGATLALQHPSRVGNRLRYRDGRVTDLQGKPQAESA